jgi:hypothetical protein
LKTLEPDWSLSGSFAAALNGPDDQAGKYQPYEQKNEIRTSAAAESRQIHQR